MRGTLFLYSSKREIGKYISKPTNPAMKFPCLDKLDEVTFSLKNHGFSSLNDFTVSSRIDPVYGKVISGYKLFKSNNPLVLDYGGILPNFQIAYETWGKLNENKDNAILLHTGLSASSHARSSPENNRPGWWENFIGPGNPVLDTNKFFIICTNVLGSCYGSTGPSSLDPSDNMHYATRFPIISIHDIVRAQNRLIRNQFGIKSLHASVGGSMGGMQSLAYGQLFPDEVKKIVSVSACAKSHPCSISVRYTQRQVLMADPHWNRGFYYPTNQYPNRVPPHVGMKLAREIATISYRSGPEWEARFGSERLDDSKTPVLCPDFLIERYLDHQGKKFSLDYDANSFLYLSKAIDLFDLSKSHQIKSKRKRLDVLMQMKEKTIPSILLDAPYESNKKTRVTTSQASKNDLIKGIAPLKTKNILIIGVKSDLLFPYWQQREIVEILGNTLNIKYIELDESQSLYGHDTFLLDLQHVGTAIGTFLNNI